MSASILNKILSPPTASKPASNRARNNSNTDDYDDSSSYFQRTVCLFDWWLIKAEKDFQGNRVAVAGFTSRELQAMRVFTSAPIVKRFDVFTLETADGICIVLKGFINKSRTIENGFSSEVFSHFVFGFPTNWEKLLGKEFTAGTGSATCSDINKSATVLEFAAVAGLANSGLNTTPSKYKENDKKKHNLENIHDCSENVSGRITTNGSKGLDSTNLTTEHNNMDNAKNYTSDNLPPLVFCFVNTVSSLDYDLAVPGAPSSHHVTESSERVANSESNRKCNKGTVRDSRTEEPSHLESVTVMNYALGKSPVPNDSDNLNLSHLDPALSRGNSGVEWMTISSSPKTSEMQKERDKNKDGLNYGKKDGFTACLSQDSEAIFRCAGEKSSGVECLNFASSGLEVMHKDFLSTSPIDGHPNVPEVLGNYINDTTNFPVVHSAMNVNSTPLRVDTNAIKLPPSNSGGGKGISSLRNLKSNQKEHSGFNCSDKHKSKELMSGFSELSEGENLKRCSSQGTIHSGRKTDTLEAIRSQSLSRMIRNLLENSKGKVKERKTVVNGLKARRNEMNSVSVISDRKSNTVQNDISERMNVFNLTDDGHEEPTYDTLVKDNSKKRQDRRKISQTGTPRKNLNNFTQRPSGPGEGNCQNDLQTAVGEKERRAKQLGSSGKKANQRPSGSGEGNCQSDLQTAVGEKERSAKQLGSFGKKAQRKINFDAHASPLTQERKEKISIISPESLSLKRSRSGRLLLPSLHFWRNQVAVYDADRKITGIQEAVDDVKPYKGSKSEPRVKRRQ
ncbi:hypothetical protein Patl1_31919 [Pistacia atlantica]|uniref:Uncharacterized protein n=1 Tax=Pistacia atlantica TaxID=434234 RepID=A0ACC1ARL7_9ROSI|nr:hypothetical protein Patl1_31919 [Pistacia atlantica]